jgi:hypothetical protein
MGHGMNSHAVSFCLFFDSRFKLCDCQNHDYGALSELSRTVVTS